MPVVPATRSAQDPRLRLPINALIICNSQIAHVQVHLPVEEVHTCGRQVLLGTKIRGIIDEIVEAEVVHGHGVLG